MPNYRKTVSSRLDDEGGRLLGTMQVNGTSHHLCFIRLREPGVAFKEEWQVELDKVREQLPLLPA